MVPEKVYGHDTEALLDSGSMVMLVTMRLLNHGTERGRAMFISCVHGDIKRYPTLWANIVMPQGSCQMLLGAVSELPVPLLVGKDCLLFVALWRHNLRKNPPKDESEDDRRLCGPEANLYLRVRSLTRNPTPLVNHWRRSPFSLSSISRDQSRPIGRIQT